MLRSAAVTEGPTFSPWEEAAGIAFTVQQPVTNMIVQNRTWGTVQDYESAAYFKVEPDLARSWEQSQDGLTWTFRFQEGVMWSDGAPFTCADAKWALDAIRTGEGLQRSPRAVHFSAVQEIACPDDLTMVINLVRPKPALLEMVAMGYNMVFPSHIYANNTEALRQEPAKAGTGPFTLQEWVPGEKYTFVRKEDYWNKPFPYLDGIEVPILGAQAQLTAMRAGRLDLGRTGFTWSSAQAEQLQRECADCQFFKPHSALSISNVIYVNHERAPWNTPAVKDALSLAVDRLKAVQVLAQGWGEPPRAGGVFFPGTYWAMPYERVKTVPGYDLENPEANKQRARDLLAQAGYQPGELTLTLGWWQSGGASAPVSITEDLEAVGFSVTLEETETARAYEKLTNADFDVRIHGHFLGSNDPDVMFYEHFYTGSDRNYGRYSNPEVDRMIDEMSVTLDPEERRSKAWDVAEIVLRDQAKIFSYHGVSQPILGARVRGVMPGDAAISTYGPWHRQEHTWLVE
jgi:peptide/nickel transport system substrate-binding protein